MCVCPAPSAAMTSPSALRLLLMAWPSFSVCPSAPVRFMRSLPARSTNESLPRRVSRVCRSVPASWMVKIWWERLLAAFMSVDAVFRAALAAPCALLASSGVGAGTSVRFVTRIHPVLSSSLMSSRAGAVPGGRRRSVSASMYTSSAVTLTSYATFPALCCTSSYSSVTARGTRPGCSSAPWIVHVLPLPVWPYANTHTLYPSSADCSRCLVSSNTSSCVLPGPKHRSNSNVRFSFSSLNGYSRLYSLGVEMTGDCPPPDSLSDIGRILAYTLILPFMSSTWL
mmetsp:Transcript_1177/g.3880  ORF Transcript_1177/g.3880 Transcript_1177/m.3880 type:complete len:283 (+) Transcript_1177:615-1463(+)